jgi:hypothetical protein
MTHAFDGLCALINKTGVCYQCQGLREIAGEKNRGPNLVQISSAGCRRESRSLFDARTAIVRNADLESGTPPDARRISTRIFHAVKGPVA